MVCSPHQYKLQKIATPYLPAAAYLKQQNYLQTPAYQSMPQREWYTARRTDIQEKPAYQLPPHYALRYQDDERQRDTKENFQFTAAVWAPAKLESSSAIPEPSVSSTWQDYGLPLYSAPGIVKKINTPQPQEDKINRDDLMARIRQELTMMNEGKKIQEDCLCAA